MSPRWKYPYEVRPMDKAINKEIDKYFTGCTGLVEIGPKQYTFESCGAKYLEKFYNFQVRPDDVWVVTYPRSGTTLTQEMVWQTVNNDLATTAHLMERFPQLEYPCFIGKKWLIALKLKMLCMDWKCREEYDKWGGTLQAKLLEKQTERRFIKSHLPLSLLPSDLLTKGCKVIYTARNPKDVAVSNFFQHRDIPARKFTEDFETFWKLFEQVKIPRGPYWEHLIEGWENRQNNNLLFLFYEDIVKDMPGTLRKIAGFLNVPLPEEQISKLCVHLKVDNMRSNKNITIDDLTKDFVRVGKAGNWGKHFSKELNDSANSWIEEHYARTDLRFPLDLLS